MIQTLINSCMKEQGLNLSEFAEYFSEGIDIKVRQHTIGNWRRGKFNPSVRILKAAIRAYPLDDPRGRLARGLAIAIDLPELAGDLGTPTEVIAPEAVAELN